MDKHGRHTDATAACNFTQRCLSVSLIAHSQHAIHKQAHKITHTHTLTHARGHMQEHSSH